MLYLSRGKSAYILSSGVSLDGKALSGGKSDCSLTSEQTGTMVHMTSGEVETDKMDESVRYFNYLRTLADLTALASIMAVQVI